MLLQEFVGDIRPCLMNIEWLVYGNISPTNGMPA